MGRWIAIGKAPGWDDQQRFSAELKATNQWRLDAKTTITSVYALSDGRMVAEFHGATQTKFEEWLHNKGWIVESVTPIRFVAKTGDIWNMT